MLEQGEIPQLKALNLHNGTVYRWNRACYGVGGGKPHLRIENRYIPSGPTTADEIANTMFWIGVMKGKPKKYEAIHTKMNFKDAKSNFFNAARYGMSTQFVWDGKFVPSHELILDVFLPMAYRGLHSVGVDSKDIEHYLTIIENRVKSMSGSEWMTACYRNLCKYNKPFEAAQILTSQMYEKQEKNFPVSSWRVPDPETPSRFKSSRRVEHIMSIDIFSVDERDSVELVSKIMEWKNIHHMPVINAKKEMVGMLTWNDVEGFLGDDEKLQSSVGDVMRTDFITLKQGESVNKVIELMKRYQVDFVPVVRENQLVGIITSKDI